MPTFDNLYARRELHTDSVYRFSHTKIRNDTRGVDFVACFMQGTSAFLIQPLIGSEVIGTNSSRVNFTSTFTWCATQCRVRTRWSVHAHVHPAVTCLVSRYYTNEPCTARNPMTITNHTGASQDGRLHVAAACLRAAETIDQKSICSHMWDHAVWLSHEQKSKGFRLRFFNFATTPHAHLPPTRYATLGFSFAEL